MLKLLDLNPSWIGTEDGRAGVGIRFDHPRRPGLRVRLLFTNPLDGGEPLPDNENLPANNDGERWTRHGADFASISITPSIDGEGWHGYVTRGEVS